MEVFLLLILASTPILALGRTAALILARGGSKGVYLKNLQNVGEVSLLARAIQAAKLAGLKVTVSTEHPLIALETLRYGASTFHRSKITATDWAPSIWAASEFIATKPDVNVLVLLQATSPFIQAKNIRAALEKINSFDCVFSVVRSYKLRWRKVNGQVVPINFDPQARPRRQDWSGELLETGGFYVSRRHLIEKGYLQSNNHFQGVNKLIMSSNTQTVTFEDLESTDVLSVELVPERKGLILKHCEYYVSSRRFGTTVTRRYNEFAQLYDVLYAKYPYRAVCRLPPKRVVVGGGSPRFLQRRRAALQRWLTLVARHPVLAHDADLRSFLTEAPLRLEKPKHDEFVLAGTQEDSPRGSMPTEEMQATFVSEQEQLRLVQLGLDRLFQIFERVESRCEAERADIRELAAGLNALSSPAAAGGDTDRWAAIRQALKAGADLAIEVSESAEDLDLSEEGPSGRMVLALDGLQAWRGLCARLTRGLHAERARAAAAAPHSAASTMLRARHRYALHCSLEEARIARAYALASLESLPEVFRAHGSAHARVAALWADLHKSLRRP